jgi:hypothetical protein
MVVDVCSVNKADEGLVFGGRRGLGRAGCRAFCRVRPLSPRGSGRRDSNPRPSGYEEVQDGDIGAYLQPLCDLASRNLRLNFAILLDGLLDENGFTADSNRRANLASALGPDRSRVVCPRREARVPRSPQASPLPTTPRCLWCGRSGTPPRRARLRAAGRKPARGTRSATGLAV